ncbi:histone deacetylase [Leishmania donovani]|uniref:histone deacetylase n=3 Tax=Leishmania donovani species complex TaxID=38574 RepID=A0A6L0XJZ4_LEIIN|nr:putative histone deacetylase [Leishmania infantum JPCM5]CAC9491925.1 histone_deacetylase_-_putative [Leishmania infantum]CAJ1989217.1 histone deacetylase [Leishmania donovani]CAM68400.1 putative histone deacetylase [Leishmania infantum JPCM5]SUZ42222.1 histone_deacetylase_-_putative [Leishmania infantum]VDZ45088.1 histone_deacetylase_putative/GeneDB:LmjF.24.1370 [Leishmania donovani]|eukprot:XP_001465967.1 putative histone deacetylase [Leishmania infantum JPCM5]
MSTPEQLPALSAAGSPSSGGASSHHSPHEASLSFPASVIPGDASAESPRAWSMPRSSTASEESAATSQLQQKPDAPESRLGGRKVVYFVDHSVTSIAYAEGHLMRPSRVRALHALVHSLGLDNAECMTVCHARPATAEEMGAFHRSAYLECLRQAPVICGNPLDEMSLAFQKEFDVPFASQNGDCPLFPEVWALVSSQAGASLACAEALVRGDATVAMNWAGGMHHAAAAHASGFCFVNDIVLCIRRLLRHYQRVLYVDLDVHHGDGVEGAFYGNHRVMTLSLHQFGNGFFPGTGDYPTRETADSFAINVPLPTRTGDAAYLLSFRTALSSVVQCFDPEAMVVQCGADTIAGDLIGRLCVTTLAHTQCVADVLSLERPTVLLGGGGYHVFHTARCWAIHTATALGRTAAQLPLYIPRTDPYYMDYRRECTPKRPTLHVFLDPDVDDPLPLGDSLAFWRQLCRSIQWQMRAARLVRQGFFRTLQLCRQRRAALLRQFATQEAGRESGIGVSGPKRPRSANATDRDAKEGVEDRVVSA